MDSIGGFLSDECERLPRWSVPIGRLYEEYVKWADSEHEKPMRKKSFSMSLQERGFKAVKEGHNNARNIVGLRLRADASGLGGSFLEQEKTHKEHYTRSHSLALSSCAHEGFSWKDKQKICDDCGVVI
jgi:phage/plasmid-associated DNA primase